MTNRIGAGRGTGKGYKNLRSFPRDASIHSDSSKGRKQPQRIPRIPSPYNEISRLPYYKKKQIINELEKEGNKIEQYDIKKSDSPLKKNKQGEVILYQHMDEGNPTGLFYEVAYYEDGEVQILDETE